MNHETLVTKLRTTSQCDQCWRAGVITLTVEGDRLVEFNGRLYVPGERVVLCQACAHALTNDLHVAARRRR